MMRKINGKNLAAAIMMSMAFSFSCAAAPEAVSVVPESAPAVVDEVAVPEAAPAATTVAVQVEVKQPVVQEVKEESKGRINWENPSGADVTAMGVGIPPQTPNPAQAKALARRAAIVDAQRNLLDTLKGAQIDADTLMENLMIINDTVKSKVSGLIVGAHVVDEGVNEDGSYYVRMSIPMYGKEKSVAAVALPAVSKNVTPEPLPKVTDTVLPKAEVKEIKKVKYTGVVVDADNMGLEATFAPAIYDTNGRIVYGLANLDKDKAISEGMVGYANVVQDATSGNRAGENPLVVKAVAVRGGKNSVNPVNVVVSVEDADKILLANENTQMLNAAAVVFVK